MGKKNIMRNGMSAQIVRYGSANDIDIMFSNGIKVIHKNIRISALEVWHVNKFGGKL